MSRVFEVIKARRSIRRYEPKPIPREDLEKIFEAARLAPSAKNLQPWRFVVITDPEKKKELAKACWNQMFVADAAVIVVALSDPNLSPRWHDKDTMIAIEHMVLVAADLGYGTCWIGAFDNQRLKRLLRIPEQVQVVAVIPMGYPLRGRGWRTSRKRMEEIVSFEKYEE